VSASAALRAGVGSLLDARPGLAAVAGALTIAFSAILVALADVSPSTAAILRCAYALPVLGALAWWERRRSGPWSRRDRRLALVAGGFFAADLILWHHAIADVGAGLATVLGNLQVVVVPLLAFLVLGERPGGRVLAALPLVMVGVVLISGALEEGAYGAEPVRGVVFGILTGLTYGAFIVVLRQGNADLRRPASPLFGATLTATIVATAAGLALGEADLAPSWPAHGWLLALALSSQVVGWLIIGASLPRLPAALGSLTLTIQPVGSVALGVLLLGEAPSLLQLLGGLGIVAALLVVATRPRGGGAGAGPERGAAP